MLPPQPVGLGYQLLTPLADLRLGDILGWWVARLEPTLGSGSPYRSPAAASAPLVLVGEVAVAADHLALVHETDDLAALLVGLRLPGLLGLLAWLPMDGQRIPVLEHHPGWTLHTVLERALFCRRPLPVAATLQIGLELCSALEHLHGASVEGTRLDLIHRDVSPRSVLVGLDGVVKLLPPLGQLVFAIGGSEARRPPRRYAYFSPEQARGLPLTPASDLFSVGVLLFELLTARLLFAGETDFELLMAAREAVVTPPSASRPAISPEIDQLVLGALDRSPSRRYVTAAEMLGAIRARPELAAGPAQLATYLEGVGGLDIE